MNDQMKDYMKDHMYTQLEEIGQNFTKLHLLLTDGLANVWSGEGYDAHEEAEDLLFEESTEILESIMAGVRHENR